MLPGRDLTQVKCLWHLPPYTAPMRTKPTLTAKLLAVGAGFLMVALASIGLTLWVTWKLEGGAAAVNEAGRLRMNMLRMVLVLHTESPEAVLERARQFDASLELLRTGDPSRPLFVPWSDETRERFDAIRQQWTEARTGFVSGSGSAADRAQTLARADAFVRQVDGFVEAIEIQIAGWTAALHLFQLFMMALAFVAAVTFMAVSYLLVINPVARLQDGPEARDFTVREVDGDEKAQWWERGAAVWPDYDAYQAATERPIPVFVLEPSA